MSSSGLDLESQQRTVLLIPRNSPRERWRRGFFLSLQERKLIHKADDNGSPAFLRSVSVSTSTSYYSTVTSPDDDTEEVDQQVSEIMEVLSTSPQVSASADLDSENDNYIRDANLQQTNIAKMVKEKDLNSVQKFGGIGGIAEALGSDLQKGIPGHDQDLHSRRIAQTLSTTQTTALGYFQFLPKSCNNYTILLLFVSAVLSLGFGIKEEGMKTGWYEGVIIILVIFIIVVVDSLREFQLAHSRKISEKQKPLMVMQRMMVDVVRGGCLKQIFICDVLIGDIVHLKRDHIVPADGLFISNNESLKVDDGSESIIDDKNPFLFYGAKVTDGTGRMLVASVGMDTTWGNLMNQVTNDLDKTSLPAQLDKVNNATQISGLIISIIILVALFLRFMLQKEDVDSNLPDFKGKPIGSKERMHAIERIVMKPNGKISTLTALLATLLVGVMEGLPFFITLAISYLNKKMLFGKAFAKDLLACLTMSSITTLCIDTTVWLSFINPVANEIREIKVLQNAGVEIILVSVDDVSVLETMHLECGLVPNLNRLVLKGEDFQNYSHEERMDKVDKIFLMERSLPSDKLLLMQYLKKKGHLVAMVGVKTNEIPALREAKLRIATSFSNEMVIESSDIIIWDGSFSSFVTIVKCGRCTYHNIRKYIQLELTMNIAGLLITSITTMFCGSSPITTIQLLWTNCIVALFGGLGLLTEPPTEKLMERLQFKPSEPLITKAMWRNLLIQALYQAAILMTFQFRGQTILGVSEKVNKTLIFNCFVLCQVFNKFSAREVESKVNVFKHIHRNPLFWVSVGLILISQVGFIEIAHNLAGNASARLNWVQWLMCLLVGMVSVTLSPLSSCLTGLLGSHVGSNSMVSLTPLDSTSNLELPLTQNESRTIVS